MIKTFQKDGKVNEVQVEVGDDIFAVRKKRRGYEFQIAGRRATNANRGLLREFIARLRELEDDKKGPLARAD